MNKFICHLFVVFMLLTSLNSCNHLDGIYETILAQRAEKNKEYDKAIEHLNKVIELEPYNTTGYNNRGFVYQKMGEYAKSIDDFNFALSMDSLGISSSYLYNNRGLSRIYLGQLEEGGADINISITRNINNAYAFRNKAIYFAQKHMNDSVCFYLRGGEDRPFYEDLKLEFSELAQKYCR